MGRETWQVCFQFCGDTQSMHHMFGSGAKIVSGRLRLLAIAL